MHGGTIANSSEEAEAHTRQGLKFETLGIFLRKYIS